VVGAGEVALAGVRGRLFGRKIGMAARFIANKLAVEVMAKKLF
jgi:predicted RecB family endonuclease